jgi:hypothetical protein
MLTKLTIRNFKRFDDVSIDLSHGVVFIGPNNSGKTTALQALTLWEIGMRRWQEKRGDKPSSQKSGVAINRRDLFPLPIPESALLWKDMHLRLGTTARKGKSPNILIDIIVEGVTKGVSWKSGLEFDYNNDETFYCRPLRLSEDKNPPRMQIPPEALEVRVAFLPPMSGLADREFIKQAGEIGFLIGQGQTAQVLRNLCFRVCYPDSDPSRPESPAWNSLNGHLKRLFGVSLLKPHFYPERSEIVIQYSDKPGSRFDLSSAGRGLQQTLLILAYLYANPRTVLLLDEPDAHLEVLRQRQIFNLILDITREQESQLIAASHSEIVLSEAANKTQVVAFLGKPHLITNKPGQLLKSLTDIGWDQYAQAEQLGWVLYLEDSTDLDILKAFARIAKHPALADLEKPFFKPLGGNVPNDARTHFYGLKEAKEDLVGIALLDHLDKNLEVDRPLRELMWQKREIENYFCSEVILMRWVGTYTEDDLFAAADREAEAVAMREAIDFVSQVLRLNGNTPWAPMVKASDEVLDLIFRRFYETLKKPLGFRKRDYCRLADLLKPDELDPEILEKLDAIHAVALSVQPSFSDP